MNSQRYLITGGAGFIGGTLARELASRGGEVHILDLPEKICQAGAWLDSVIVHSGNVADPSSFLALPSGNWDIAFHLAAQTSARVSEERPGFDIDSNVKGALNFCNWARSTKPTRAVFTSSMAVYGWTGDNIVESKPVEPVSVYGVTKCAGEQFFRILRSEGIQATIFRLFNVYGPGQDFSNMSQGMLSIYLAQALTQNEVVVTGTLDRYRDFVHVRDVVAALLLELKIDDPWILNVGNGRPIQVSELLDRILHHVRPWKPTIKVRCVESHRGDVFGNYANTNAIRQLNWTPKVDLDTGIAETVIDARMALGCK